MEAQPPQSSPTSIAEIGSLARAVEAERAGCYVVAWQEALLPSRTRLFCAQAGFELTVFCPFLKPGGLATERDWNVTAVARAI